MSAYNFKETTLYKKASSLVMETIVWIDFAFACQYINEETKNLLTSKSEEVGKLLFHMINNPEKY